MMRRHRRGRRCEWQADASPSVILARCNAGLTRPLSDFLGGCDKSLSGPDESSKLRAADHEGAVV